MTTTTSWFLLLFTSTSGLLMGLSVPLIRGLVPPNLVYGVRTRKTLSDDATWYRANAYGGLLLFRSGLAGLVSAVALFGVPSLRADVGAYNLACGAVILGGLLVSGALIFREIRGI